MGRPGLVLMEAENSSWGAGTRDGAELGTAKRGSRTWRSRWQRRDGSGGQSGIECSGGKRTTGANSEDGEIAGYLKAIGG